MKGDGRRPSKGRSDEVEESEESSEDDIFNALPTKGKKTKSDNIDVEFELVIPSEAYYHSARALL